MTNHQCKPGFTNWSWCYYSGVVPVTCRWLCNSLPVTGHVNCGQNIPQYLLQANQSVSSTPSPQYTPSIHYLTHLTTPLIPHPHLSFVKQWWWNVKSRHSSPPHPCRWYHYVWDGLRWLTDKLDLEKNSGGVFERCVWEVMIWDRFVANFVTLQNGWHYVRRCVFW